MPTYQGEVIVFNDKDGTASVTKKSIISGIVNTRQIPIVDSQYRNWKERGMLIQDAMPHLSADDREFLMSGITPEEWDAHYGNEEE